MAKKEFAPGLPDPRRFGSPSQLPLNKLLSYVIQQHDAQRAGRHYDIRFGPDRGNAPTMMSWASRHLPAKPGEKRMAFQQPLHTGQYADFEGEIVQGYGKGTVKTHERGSVIVTKATPNQITFVVTHKKHPETYTLLRRTGPPAKPETARQMRSQGGSWLMINTTPQDVIKHKKVHYTNVPAAEVSKLFSPDYLHQEKIDGAAALYKVLSDRIEVMSYRPTTKGRPIVHTYRVGGTTGINIPKHLVGSVLRGELYGVRTSTGRAIPPQQLGGILNATTQRAIEKQRKEKVDLKSTIFNVLRYGKKDVPIETPLDERLKMLGEFQQYLPKGKFRLPEMARTPEEQKNLWERITSGKHPLTHEGIVAWPIKGGKPSKVKLYSEHDVHVREIFPGEKGLAGTGAGGFRYSLTPGGRLVGKVGTGFSAATRKQMWETPEEFAGRVARIKAQEQFPSGAYRAPSFIGLHEDYPAVKAAAQLTRQDLEDYQRSQGMMAPTTLGEGAETLGGMAAFGGALTGANLLTRAGLRKLTPWFGRGYSTPLPAGVAGPVDPNAYSSLGKALKGKVPKSMLGGVKMMYQPGLFMAALELLGNLSRAGGDPEYAQGKIGYLGSLGKQISQSGRAAGIKRRQAFSGGPLGWLKGVALTPMHATMNPIATIADLVQTIRGTGSKAADEKVLTPLIKKALDDKGETMGDLVKAASELPGEGPSMMDRIRAFLFGVTPEEFTEMRGKVRGASQTYDTIKQFLDSLRPPNMPTEPAGNI